MVRGTWEPTLEEVNLEGAIDFILVIGPGNVNININKHFPPLSVL